MNELNEEIMEVTKKSKFLGLGIAGGVVTIGGIVYAILRNRKEKKGMLLAEKCDFNEETEEGTEE